MVRVRVKEEVVAEAVVRSLTMPVRVKEEVVVVGAVAAGEAISHSPFHRVRSSSQINEGLRQPFVQFPLPTPNPYPIMKSVSHPISKGPMAPYLSLCKSVVSNLQVQTLTKACQQKHIKKTRAPSTTPTLAAPATQTHHQEKYIQKDCVQGWLENRPGQVRQVRDQYLHCLYPGQNLSGNTCRSKEKQVVERQDFQLGAENLPERDTWHIAPQRTSFSMKILEPCLPHLPVGGRLTHFQRDWRLTIRDKFALSVISKGYHLDWVQVPQISNHVLHTQLKKQTYLLQEEIDQMLEKGAIEEVVPITPGFWSTFFLVPKKDTDQMRPVINLRGLNKFVKTPTFKMHTPQSILRMIHKGNWLASIDLKDAYFHVPMDPQFYKYLRFAFHGKSYQFRVLPFGLSTAPRVFTKVLAPVVGYLHQQGVHLYPYLDDCLLVEKTPDMLQRSMEITLLTLQRLGFMINVKKSQLTMTQRIHFLGMEIDTQLSTVFLPTSKVEKIQAYARTFLPAGIYRTAHHYMKFLGLMASTLTMIPKARLHMRPIQIHLNASWNRKKMGLNHKIMTPRRLVEVLLWWTQTQNLTRGMEFPPRKHSITVTTDASKIAWGAHCDLLRVQHRWNMQEQALHINQLELLAVWNALKAFIHLVQDKTVLVQTDNTSVLHYINNSGGTRSVLLCQMTWDMMQWCINHNIDLQATHIPGKDNVLADSLSRHVFSNLEWSLNDKVVQTLFKQWSTPSIDLFANHHNAKLIRFCALRFHPQAVSTNALTMSWRNLYLYAFPPFPIIARVLAKIRQDQATAILIAPMWSRREWYPLLIDMLIQEPLMLPRMHDLITQDQGRMIHSNLEVLSLVAWKVSGIDCLQQAFRFRLHKQSLRQHLRAQGEHTLVAGMTSLRGVTEMVTIPVLQLWM
jgi:hypothetical protein